MRFVCITYSYQFYWLAARVRSKNNSISRGFEKLKAYFFNVSYGEFRDIGHWRKKNKTFYKKSVITFSILSNIHHVPNRPEVTSLKPMCAKIRVAMKTYRIYYWKLSTVFDNRYYVNYFVNILKVFWPLYAEMNFCVQIFGLIIFRKTHKLFYFIFLFAKRDKFSWKQINTFFEIERQDRV